ncbi:Ca2+-binding actin-bundling protein [Rhizoctonia solani AG-1 IA]|uniref:Ca2+-binding actin-bundling protein n=1 Tax=Thanatephorus cucumeris (strain AG1-IA) TaxID=983506 RepID=L8X4C4_THACA|nr:Ca2+-binding actin-bundling protein [Rhizoctonia solani AG-1 IA]
MTRCTASLLALDSHDAEDSSRSWMQALKLQRKYPQVNALDVEGTGAITKADAISALQSSGEGSYDQVREVLKGVSVDASGKVELEDWVELVTKLRTTRAASILPTKAGKVTVQGSNANVSHTINEDERSEFTIHINGVRTSLFDVMDTKFIFEIRFLLVTQMWGLVYPSRRITCSSLTNAETIDTRVLNVPKTKKGLNAFQITENNNIVITSAKAIGCSVVNIGSSDIAEGREHLILGLIWQVIRRGLLSKIDLKNHPELYRLLEEGETVEDLLKLPPDQLLLRWFNYHLRAAGHKRNRDVADGENYTILLNQLKPNECSRAPLQERDLLKRAELVLQNADKIGCRKYLSAQAMVAGNPKLNLAFTAHLFNTHPGLAPLEEPNLTQMPTEAVEDFDAEGEREARVFTLWLNSLNVEPSVYSLFNDLKDGVVILQAFDKVSPGSVVWRRVSKPKPVPTSPVQQSFVVGGDEEDEGPVPHAGLSRFKAVENNNYAVELAKSNGMHIVGIQGSDIVDGTKTLVLGLVWQLMRLSIYKTLSSLTKSGRPPTDQDILSWANNTVRSRSGATPNSPPLRSFKLTFDLVCLMSLTTK